MKQSLLALAIIVISPAVAVAQSEICQIRPDLCDSDVNNDRPIKQQVQKLVKCRKPTAQRTVNNYRLPICATDSHDLATNTRSPASLNKLNFENYMHTNQQSGNLPVHKQPQNAFQEKPRPLIYSLPNIDGVSVKDDPSAPPLNTQVRPQTPETNAGPGPGPGQ